MWSDQPNAFSEHQLQLFSELGTQAAITIQNARKNPSDERDWVAEILKKQGLGAAVRAFLACRQKAIETSKLTLDIETRHPGGEISRQEAKIEATIYAIVQEAVNNALKHAQAGTIQVRLKETPAEICASVVDDGKGFDVDRILHNHEQQDSRGLFNVWERTEPVSGTLTIESGPGQGTRIEIYVPKAQFN